MLLVTGANGNLARRIIAHLRTLIDSKEIAVTTSNPDSPHIRELAAAGISVRIANFNEPDTLPAALSGIRKMLLIPTWDDDAIRIRQNLAVIDAAQQAGVGHFMFTSFINASPTSLIGRSRDLYYPTEQAIIKSGMTYTMIRDSFYAEAMFPGLDLANAEQLISSGIFEWLGGDAACAYIGRDDAAIAFAEALAGPGHENKTYTLTMTKAYTGAEIARAFSRAYGREIRYQPITEDTWVDWWKRQRDFVPDPEEQARKQVGLFRAMWNGDLDFASQDYAAIAGTSPRSFEQLFADTLKKVYINQ